MIRVFISGKVSQLAEAEYKANFEKTEKRLREAGITNIFNPAKEIPFGTPWKEAMDICLPEIAKADLVVFQTNWKQSFGARWEFTEANRLKKQIRFDTDADMLEIKVNLQRFISKKPEPCIIP